MKKRGETTPNEKVGSPPSGRPPRRYQRENSHNSYLETEETGDRHLESLLRSRQPSKDAGSKRDDKGSPGKSPLLHGRLEDYGQQGRNRDIHPEEKREHKPQDIKSQLHKFHRTSSH